MIGGYTGKILRLNLTKKSISTIDTEEYEEYGGGFGIGAAIFWDFAAAPAVWDMKNAYDPQNVIILMSSPLAATGVLGAGRTSVCGLSPEVYPAHTFSRANFGGRYATTGKTLAQRSLPWGKTSSFRNGCLFRHFPDLAQIKFPRTKIRKLLHADEMVRARFP
jgi:hypothetical protein